MTLRIPDQGEAAFLTEITGPSYTLRLFTNDPEDGLTPAQIQALTEAAFVEASFTGYTAEALTAVNWTITTGDPTEAAHTLVEFESSVDQTAQTVTGYYVTQGTALRCYEYFSGPVLVEFNGDIVRISPRLTLQDTIDAA